jgi:hypothetical protein
MKRRLTILALTTLAVVALIGIVLTINAPAQADGATQISGIGYFPGDEGSSGRACDKFPDFPGDPDDVLGTLALDMTGDPMGDHLEGCFYTYVLTSKCKPSGAYNETGINIFVGDYLDEEENVIASGSFDMTYRFTAKYELDDNGDCDFNKEIFGRCQHPIVKGSGTADFEGVTGRLDLRDDLDAGNFPYRGHLRFP